MNGYVYHMHGSWNAFSHGKEGQGMRRLHFAEKNGMQNVKAVSLHKNTSTVHRIKKEKHFFSPPNTEGLCA